MILIDQIIFIKYLVMKYAENRKVEIILIKTYTKHISIYIYTTSPVEQKTQYRLNLKFSEIIDIA
jgi:hypothetical protein